MNIVLQNVVDALHTFSVNNNHAMAQYEVIDKNYKLESSFDLLENAQKRADELNARAVLKALHNLPSILLFVKAYKELDIWSAVLDKILED